MTYQNNFLITEKAKSIKPFITLDIMEKAQQQENKGLNIIHMEVGEPDFETPSVIKDAAIEAIQKGDTHYTNSLGKIEFRKEIVHYYQRKYNIDFSPDQVLVTSGTSPAMYLIFAAILEQGDEVILSYPYYACYPKIIKILGGNPVIVPDYEEDHNKYDINAIKK